MNRNSSESPSTKIRPRHVAVCVELPAVEIRGRLKSGTGAVFVLLGMATLGGLLFVTVSPRADANPRNSVGILLTTAALLGSAAAIMAFRMERLVIDAEEIRQEKSLAGVRWMHRRMSRVGVDALRVQARGPGGRGLAIIGPHGRLLVGSSLEEADLEWLRDWVAARLR